MAEKGKILRLVQAPAWCKPLLGASPCLVQASAWCKPPLGASQNLNFDFRCHNTENRKLTSQRPAEVRPEPGGAPIGQPHEIMVKPGLVFPIDIIIHPY